MNLEEKLKKIINQKKWYKISKSNYNQAGLLLEKLLGLENNDLPISDYDEYEIKTKYVDDEHAMTLFHAAPDSYLYEIKRIYDTYAYPSPSNPEVNVFLSAFYCSKITTLGKEICGRLFIDKEKKVITLKIYNFKTNTLDDKVSWSFDLLEERINLKLKKICYVGVERKFIGNNLYCRFNNYKIYKFKGFNKFLDCLKYGHISIKFCINVYKTGIKAGQMHDHGTCFDIKTDKFDYLFRGLTSA